MYGDFMSIEIDKREDGTINIVETDVEGNTRTYASHNFGHNVEVRLREIARLVSKGERRSILDIIFDDDLIVDFEVLAHD